MAKSETTTASKPDEERTRRLEASRLQEIEGNPLTADETAMFEMFEREGWSDERRRAYIRNRLTDSRVHDKVE